MSQDNNEQINSTTENNTAADVVDQQVQESSDQGESSSWGSWWSSTIGNVVRVMNHQTNQFGQQLQKLVEEGDESTTPTTPTTTTTTNEEKVEEENGEINDNGGEANTSSLIEQTEKTIETSFKSAESTIKSFFSTISGVTSTVYAETSQLVDETVELKFVKGLATQFGKTVLNTLEEASKILYDAEESDDGIHIYVNFKELFIEYEGLKHLQEIAALAKNGNQELEKYMEERTDQERETIEKILRELREIMIESTQFSTKEVEEKKSIYQYIANLPVGKEVIEMTNSSVELSKNAYNNLEDVLASTTEVSEMLQTSTILLEKSKAECYRSLAKLASLASNHILILSKHLLDPSNSGILPIQWKDSNSNSKDAKHVATLLRDYLLFLYSQLIEISNQYTEALKKNTQIVGIKLDEQQREKLEVRAMKMASRLHIHSDKALSIIISCDKEFLDILQYLASVWIQ